MVIGAAALEKQQIDLRHVTERRAKKESGVVENIQQFSKIKVLLESDYKESRNIMGCVFFFTLSYVLFL